MARILLSDGRVVHSDHSDVKKSCIHMNRPKFIPKARSSRTHAHAAPASIPHRPKKNVDKSSLTSARSTGRSKPKAKQIGQVFLRHTLQHPLDVECLLINDEAQAIKEVL